MPMKSPISYYGGKQQMIGIILLNIPSHKVYCEPFFGGGAVFFAKQPSKIEIINDKNDMLINFYRVMQNNFDELEQQIKSSLHSRSLFNRAKQIYKNPEKFDDIQKAWSVWTLLTMDYFSWFGSGFLCSTTENIANRVANRRNRFSEIYKQRLEAATIECDDAINIIKKYDTADTFFYLDPPYVNSEQKHYKGYTQKDLNSLLDILSNIKGKFLLSHFENDCLENKATQKCWNIAKIQSYNGLTSFSNGSGKKTKIEMLVSNYPIDINLANTKSKLVYCNYNNYGELFNQ